MKILVLCLPGLGDTLMFTPALKVLRDHFPDAQIKALVMYKSSFDVLDGNPNLDEVILWEFLKEGSVKSLKFMVRLRKERFDMSIIAFPANRLQYNMVSFLAGAKLRLGHRYKHQNLIHFPFLNHKTILESDELHNVEENLRLLELLGVRPEDFRPTLEIFPSKEDTEKAGVFWEEHGLARWPYVFGMHVWSTTLKDMHFKCWDKAKFAALIDQLKERYNCEFLLFEGPHDQEVNTFILKTVRHKPIIVRDTTVKETAALLKRCNLLITNDSGVMHVGAAIGVPLVAIFGPTNDRWVGPFTERRVLVKKNLPCQPCFIYSTKHLECKAGLNFECLTSIAVEDVLAAVERSLDVLPVDNGPGTEK
ncbi:MAG: glycosyltransferase family 9 protein [Gemmatimonadota bacterium]|nr:MAG: glycosyltransferase family 9 protein [Gemmatimonadota bacterium]